MTAATLTLTDFLLARIAEDEARAADIHDIGGDGCDRSYCDCGVPARVLAECEAKRRIVEEVDATRRVNQNLPADAAHLCIEFGLDRILCILALPYADHPDYRQEWKP